MEVAFAVADPVRREIMTMLRDRVMSAGEIAGCFDISRPGVSRHLRVLRECGLVVDEVRGRERLYRLDTEPLRPLAGWLAELHDRWSVPLDALATEVHRTRRERRGSRNVLREKSA
ncbi:MAG: metalloregulator ArsR/SmtB family transcription factor [Gemmatimonadota bacterium]